MKTSLNSHNQNVCEDAFFLIQSVGLIHGYAIRKHDIHMLETTKTIMFYTLTAFYCSHLDSIQTLMQLFSVYIGT